MAYLKGANETLVASIGERILALRSLHNMNQQELAAALEISTSALRNIENGSTAPRLYTLNMLSNVFDVPIDYIVRGITPGSNYDTWKQTGLDDAALHCLEQQLDLGKNCGGLDEYKATLNRMVAGGFPVLVWKLNELNRELQGIEAEIAAISGITPKGDDTAALLFEMEQGEKLAPLLERRDLLKLRYLKLVERFFEKFIKGDD